MKIHIQIEYKRKNSGSESDKLSCGDEDVPVESLLGIEHTDVKFIREMFEEFITAIKYDPYATFSIGGECKCHKK